MTTIQCIHCQGTRATALAERAHIEVTWPIRFATMRSTAPCCDPYSESRCPFCNSTKLQFCDYDYGMDSQTGYQDEGEHAHCLNCGKTCEASDAAPAVQPWTELAAVAEAINWPGDWPVIPVLQPITIQVAKLTAPEFLRALEEEVA